MALSAGQVKSVELYSGVESQPIEASEPSGTVNFFYKGDLVKFNGSGQIAAVASTGAIAGIAGSTATGTANTTFDLALLDPAAIYVMRMLTTSNSALAYVGEISGLDFTTGIQRIDISKTTQNDIYIVGVHPSDVGASDAGIDEGRMLVRFGYIAFAGV